MNKSFLGDVDAFLGEMGRHPLAAFVVVAFVALLTGCLFVLLAAILSPYVTESKVTSTDGSSEEDTSSNAAEGEALAGEGDHDDTQEEAIDPRIITPREAESAEACMSTINSSIEMVGALCGTFIRKARRPGASRLSIEADGIQILRLARAVLMSLPTEEEWKKRLQVGETQARSVVIQPPTATNGSCDSDSNSAEFDDSVH